MPTTRKQKKARKSRGLEMLSHIENLDIMLGENHFERNERNESVNSNQAGRPESLFGDEFGDENENGFPNPGSNGPSPNTELGHNSIRECSSVEINRLSSELNSRISRDMDEMMNSVSVQIQRAINEAISSQILPQIQNVVMAGSGQLTKERWNVPAERPEGYSEALQNSELRNNSKNKQTNDRSKDGFTSTNSRAYDSRSFNICNRRICELNQDDVFSIGVKNQHLVMKKKGCNYHGKRKNFAPICDPNSVDPSSDFCGTGGKPVHRVWFMNDSVRTNVKNAEVMKYKVGEVLVDFAHGGNPGTRPFEILQRLKILKIFKIWIDAKLFCAAKGGILFSNLDGSSEQLEMLVVAQGGVSFWLGLRKDPGNKSIYNHVGGGSFPDEKILWADNQPNNGINEDYLFVTSAEKKVADAFGEYRLPFFCDMPLQNSAVGSIPARSITTIDILETCQPKKVLSAI